MEGGEKISLRAIIGQSPRGDKERRRWKKLSERTRADRLKNVNDSSSKLEAVALVKGNRINARKTSFGLEADPGKPLLFPRIDIVRIKPIDLLPIIGVERNHPSLFRPSAPIHLVLQLLPDPAEDQSDNSMSLFPILLKLQLST